MYITKEPLFRNFWYPVIPIHLVQKKPIPFTLLGEAIVLWLDEAGSVCAVADRCAHRSAQLSAGWVSDGHIVCPYHGWCYNGQGKCVKTFQNDSGKIPSTYQVSAFKTKLQYGYVWVCLNEPLLDIAEFPEAHLENYRLFECFYETWKTTSLRVVENELDMAHFAIVHRGTFGDPTHSLPLHAEITDLGEYSLNLHAELSVQVPEQQQKNTRIFLSNPHQTSTRLMDITWYMPFTIRLSLLYPSGLHHVIINHPTPIDDNHIQVVQFCFRNDKETDVSSEDIIKFERKIVDEDRFVLETTDFNYPLFHEYAEANMPSDKPGMMVRKKIKHFIEKYE
ncbi:MAG: aromatic ring-hydroxylating dioxygenase subunit alpha [Legionella sp.]|nr:aromatic ring-hydroxylating dioxygenase subunit alpha [Legionella sp.]